MRVDAARASAQQWVSQQALREPSLQGAYLAGSASWLPDGALLPPTSDLDINLILRGPTRLPRGKLRAAGVLLDLSHLAAQQLRSPEFVLAHYHLAGGLRNASVIFDRSGQLTELQAAVARDFTRRRWVLRRCAHARERVVEQIAALSERDPFPHQVLGWIFPTGVLAQILLVAGLRNPTVRRRYVASRALLAEYGQLELQEQLLAALGCAEMRPTRIERHIDALAAVFDAAAAAMRTPFPFASAISAAARPIAIDGSRELVARGMPREAVFWIAVTYSRCQQILGAARRPWRYCPRSGGRRRRSSPPTRRWNKKRAEWSRRRATWVWLGTRLCRGAGSHSRSPAAAGESVTSCAPCC